MKTIGIAGGGQLGRMLTEAAHTLGFKVITLDPVQDSPASQVADEHIVGAYVNRESILELAAKADLLTFEIEAVNADALHELEARGYPIHPTPKTLSIIKDKFFQKTYLRQKGIAVSDFVEVKNEVDAKAAGEKLGYPFVLKAKSGGFDGRGNATIASESDIVSAIQVLGKNCYAEKFVKFEKELAVIAARTKDGSMEIYPLVETIHRDHICQMVLAPASVPPDVAQKAHDLAQKVLKAFDGAGVFGIEMFLAGGQVLVNEVAPRVHNSGHFTIEGSETSQFEEHIRAISGMPLGSTKMKVPAAVMINILGERNGPAEPKGIADAEALHGVKVHIYGKLETRVARKMGHLTATAETLEEAKANAEKARALISI